MPIARTLHAFLFAASLAVSASAAAATGADDSSFDPGRGIAVAIGGALKPDNDAVWQRLVDLAGGNGARWAVFATASGQPEASAAAIVDALRRRGAVAEAIPVAPKLAGTDVHAAARDPALIARVLASQGVYFAGGAQERITAALLEADGRPTPVLAAIWQVYRAGGVVAGSSAGAAIMSTTMFRDAQDVLTVLKFGLRPGREIDRGLGFVGPAVFVDQHFLKRGRLGRMLPLMVQQGYRLGVGVDENSAAIFRGGEVEVIGYKGALVVDLSAASSANSDGSDSSRGAALPGFNLKNARLNYLERGDRFDLATRRATPSAEKRQGTAIDPSAAGYKPYFSADAFYPDVLADTAVANLMGNLIDNRQREVVGLAFGAPDAPAASRPELGFEFRFSKTATSRGWFTTAFGGEDYTVLDIRLDVTPVRLAQPLYQALEPPDAARRAAPASAPAAR